MLMIEATSVTFHHNSGLGTRNHLRVFERFPADDCREVTILFAMSSIVSSETLQEMWTNIAASSYNQLAI